MKKAVFILFLFPVILFAQQGHVDSLLGKIQKDKDDTNKVNDLDDLANEERLSKNYDTALYFSNTELRLAESLNFKEGIISAYSNIAILYRMNGNYPAALKIDNLNLKIEKETGDRKSEAGTYNDMGINYRLQGDFPSALKNVFSSLKIKQDIGDKRGIASAYNNIGNIYLAQEEYSQSLRNFQNALKINQELGNKEWMAINYSNIGSAYYELDSFELALKNDSAALEIYREKGDQNGVASVYNNFGTVFSDQGKHPEAIQNYQMALKIRQDIGDKVGIVSCLLNLGEDMIIAHKNSAAADYLKKALQLSKELGNKTQVKKSYKGLMKLDSALGDFRTGYADFKMYILYRDSMFNEENTKKSVEAKMNYDFGMKFTADSLKNVEQATLKDAQAQAKLQDEKTKRYALYVGIGLLLVFGGFIFNRFRVTNKQKKIIEIKNRETELQKEIIEEKQKEIVDSINYAKRIQYALLAHEKLLWANLNEHFVLFKPKDIVSGDFYWATKVERTSSSGERISKFYLACCDSTGHGVPGAFMSLLNISFLNEAIIEKNILEPNDILNHVRKRLIENISQDGGQDGMDAVLICIDKTTNKITYAAANNSPALITSGTIANLPCDKMPVGKGENLSPFTLHSIDAKKGDTLILYTDGYADQFGGPKGKKFKYKPLHELLLSTAHEKAARQSEILDQTLTEWRGNLEQVDDVLVIGIRM